MTVPREPGLTAQLDQAHTMFRDDALTYAEVARRLIEKHGEIQAGADMSGLIKSQYGQHPHIVIAILASACVELAKAGVRPTWMVSDAR